MSLLLASYAEHLLNLVQGIATSSDGGLCVCRRGVCGSTGACQAATVLF